MFPGPPVSGFWCNISSWFGGQTPASRSKIPWIFSLRFPSSSHVISGLYVKYFCLMLLLILSVLVLSGEAITHRQRVGVRVHVHGLAL